MPGPCRVGVRWAALMIVLALGVGACSSGSAPERVTELAADPATVEPVERVTVAVPADVGPLNIFAQHEEWLTELVYDKLVAPSPYVQQPQPWLASQVDAVDERTWEVTVRDDVMWHDGEAFTVDDVVFTFEYAAAAPTGRWTHHITEIPEIASVEAIDDDTVRFTCAFACPELGSITLADLPILPEHVWSEIDDPREETFLPVGTGPYRLTEYSPRTGYRFEAHGDYFASAPLVAELVMPIVVDPSATFTALRTGEVDAAARPVAPELLEQFEGSEDIAVATTAPLQFLEMRLNYERAPFDDPLFRRALSRAVDRDELLDVVVLGQGRPATSGYPHPDSPWTNPDLSTPTDAEEAQAVLEEGGYVDGDGDGVRETSDGAPIEFAVKVTGSEPTHVRAAELVAEQLAEVGIQVQVLPLDAGAIGELFRSREFDASVGAITAHGVADPTQFIMSHRSGYLWRAPDVSYPEWEALFEEWKATTTVEARTEVLFAMQELFNTRPTSIPLYYPDEHWAYRPAAFDGWAESPGYGVVHKWSLLPPDVAREANAIVEPPT